ncbi:MULTISPECIES: PDR/VanB family oxidoreductase [unclassified Streptomyces]|uniref:PDR/VanB family oxidoreductase n=1 Tax=unclassified Streptomyces TaxID=2593676 RepID=UPI00278C80BB|nr:MULTISPECIES: PDR/VanB family oxidoreductase [unclassified Streptomyces]
MNQPLDDLEGVLDLRVEQLRRESDGVVSLTLVDPDGGALPEWTPGAHIDLGLPGVVRQYSLCGDPADRFTYRVAVLREENSRGGSRYVHEALRVGELVEVGGPRNNFALAPAERYQFVAGGIGITPLLPMIAAAEASGTPWSLAYGGRLRSSMAFTAELAAHGDKVDLAVEAERGPLDLAALLGIPRTDTAVYCCGPEGLLAAVEERCADWPDGSLHIERFKAKAVAGDAAADREFEVVCDRSGTTVRVPADRTVLDCLDEAGIVVDSACREGICGSCETKVLSGDVDHRDSLLSADEQASGQTAMLCVSRARSERLVLDL